MAPVLSQPSLPILALTKARKAALGISPEELAVARERVRAGVRVLGLRFTLTNHFADREGHPTREGLDRVSALFRERLTCPATPATR
jgi:hypothetical protein